MGKGGSVRVAGFIVLCAGILLIVLGLQPYTIRDMNGDGAIDWRDYDVDGDGHVDIIDISQVARAYGSTIGDGKYNARVDFNGEGVIDDFDLNAIKDYYGQGSLSLIDLWMYRATTPKGIMLIAGIILVIVGLLVIIFA